MFIWKSIPTPPWKAFLKIQILPWDELNLSMVHSRSTETLIQATKLDYGGPKMPLLGAPPSLWPLLQKASRKWSFKFLNQIVSPFAQNPPIMIPRADLCIQFMKARNYYEHFICLQFSSVQFSRSVVSDSLWPHDSQHTRPPCPSPTPGVHSDSRSSHMS